MAKPGPKPGYKQSAEHVRKRAAAIRGEKNHAWKGDAACARAGRTRALRGFRAGPCSVCGNERGERHHIDGNTLNNGADNVVMLCRRCRMQSDGRLEEFIALARRNQPAAVAARWRGTVLPG